MDNSNNISYDELWQIVLELEMENRRLADENEKLKSKYEIGIGEEDLESMYINYYSEDNETIHT